MKLRMNIPVWWFFFSKKILRWFINFELKKKKKKKERKKKKKKKARKSTHPKTGYNGTFKKSTYETDQSGLESEAEMVKTQQLKKNQPQATSSPKKRISSPVKSLTQKNLPPKIPSPQSKRKPDDSVSPNHESKKSKPSRHLEFGWFIYLFIYLLFYLNSILSPFLKKKIIEGL